MSRRLLIPGNWFYRQADPLPPLFPEPNEGDHYWNTITERMRIYRKGRWRYADTFDENAGDARYLRRSISVISSSTTMAAQANTTLVYICASAAAMTVTLPTAVGNSSMYTIKRTGLKNVTIATTSSQTIDGAATFVVGVQYQSTDLVSDGANWVVL